MRVFVDTNILVYAHDLDAGTRHERARDLVKTLWTADPKPAISVQVLHELYVNLIRKQVPAKQAAELIEDYTAWRVIPNHTELTLAGVRACQRWQLSLWDALIIESARVAGATELFSEDLQTGQDFDGVTVVNPLQEPA